MKIMFIVFYAILLIIFLFFINRRLRDINTRNIENIGCNYLKKRNNTIFGIITFLIVILFIFGSFVIVTLI